VDFAILATVGVAFLVGGLVKGLIGVGLPLTALTLMTQVIELRVAIPLLVVPIVATNFFQAIRGGRFMELLRRFALLLAATCASIFAGVYILYRVDAAYLMIALGVIVTAYALINLLAVQVRIKESPGPATTMFAGCCAGLTAGTTGVIGPPLIIFFQAIGLAKNIFVQAIGIQFMIAGAVLTFALWREGGITLENAPVSALAMVPALLGMYLGERVRGYISEDRFRTGVFVFLVIVGLNLVRKGLF
jgi:uncharacterized membrane protein YfcA